MNSARRRQARQQTRRLAPLLTLALLGWGAVSAPAAGGVIYETSVMPEETVFPATREVTYRISMLGGERSETVRLEFAPPGWARPGARRGAPAYAGLTSLEGPGTFMPDAIAPSPPAPQDRGLALPCGEDAVAVATRRGTVQVPAGVRVTLVTTWSLSRQAPFAFTDYRPDVTAAVTGGAAHTVDLPRPRIVGPAGVPLRLLPVNRPGRAGGSIRVRGRTDAALAGEKITLRLFGPVSSHRRPALVATPERFRPVARARVDRLGRFEFRWRPAQRGQYGAYPLYRGKPGVILRDRGCPIRLVVR